MASRYNVAATLQVNNKAFIAGFAAAERSVKSFNTALHTASASTAAYQRSMAASNAAMAASLGAVGKQSTAMKNQAEGAGRSMRTLQTAAMGAAAGATAASSSSDTAGRKMGVFGKGADLAARDLDRFNRTARGFSMTAMGLAAISLGSAIASIAEFTSYESAFANFKKVTEANTREFRDFDLVFRELARNIPATYEEISNTAAAASQLGVAKEDVAKFTDTMIRMGTATDLSSEDAAFALQRMMNIFGTAGQDVDRFGSTLVQLGNNAAASESEIVNMSLRLAGMGATLGISEAETLALAASMTELGIRSEQGGSAMSTIMSKTASEIERGTEIGQNWADVMGMSIEDVQKLFEEDAYGAMVKMVEGLEKVDESGGNLDQTLRELGINEIRQLDVLKRLTGSSKDLTNAQRMANDEWEKNTALIDESNARYETFESQLRIFKNSIDNIFSNFGNAFIQSSDGIINKIVEVVQEFDRWTDTMFDAEGGLNDVGRAAVDMVKDFMSIAVPLGIVGAAFMAFGPVGGTTVAVIAGLTAIGLEFKGLVDYLGGSEAEKSMYRISEFSEGATEEAATNYVEMKDGILDSLGKLSTQSGDEAAKTRQNIVKEFESLASEAVSAIEGKRSQMNGLIEGLMVDATEPQRRALEKARTEANQHYNDQIEMTQDFAKTVNEVMSNMVDENGQITAEGMRNFEVAAGGMDEVFGTAISESVAQMQRFKTEFDTAFDESSAKGAQDALTGMAKETASAMGDLKKVYEEQVEQTKALGLEHEAEELILAGLETQYTKNKDALLENLIAMEDQAKGVDDSISATKELNDLERTFLDQTNEKTKALREAEGATMANEESITSLSAAQEKNKEVLQESTRSFNDLATEMNKIDEESKTVTDAVKNMAAALGPEANELGRTFATNYGDGIEMVDMGTYGKVTVDQFVRGIQDGSYGVTEAGIALVNKLRQEAGKGTLTPEGQAAAVSYAEGMMSEDATVASVAQALGFTTAENAKVDLGENGVVTIESFVSGLKTGEYTMFEVMQALMNNLEVLSQKDLTEFGAQDMATLAAGLESGLLDVNDVMALMGEGLQSDAQVDLGEQGIHTIGTWVEALSAGQIDVQTFMSGLETLMKEGLNVDLAENGERSMASYADAADAKAQQFVNESLQGTGTQIKEALNIDLNPEGSNTGQTFNDGFLSKKIETDALTQQLKDDVEGKLGETSDGGGGAKAPTDFSTGFINSMPLAMSFVEKLSGDAESTLGSTTDGDGGSNAGGKFASGIAGKIAEALVASNSAKSTAEDTLGSTTDASGGDKAGGMFVSGIAGQVANAASAANSNKSEVEGELGSTTDDDGGKSALQKYVSDIHSFTSKAEQVARANKTRIEFTLGSTTDDGGGKQAGTMFVSGVSGQAGSAQSAGRNVSNSARSGLSSNSNTYGLGQNFGSGFVSGIRSYVGAAVSAAASLARAALNAVKRAQRSASPSKETQKLGGDFGDGFSLAIVNKTKEAVNAARNMARDAIDAAGDESARNALAVDVGGMEYGGSAPRSVNQRIQHEIIANTADRERVVANVHIHQHGDIEWLRTEIAERDGVDATLKF